MLSRAVGQVAWERVLITVQSEGFEPQLMQHPGDLRAGGQVKSPLATFGFLAGYSSCLLKADARHLASAPVGSCPVEASQQSVPVHSRGLPDL